MIELLLCANNLSCMFKTITGWTERPKYPQDVAIICQYFEDEKTTLPEYCKWNNNQFLPKRRSDF